MSQDVCVAKALSCRQEDASETTVEKQEQEAAAACEISASVAQVAGFFVVVVFLITAE